MYGIDALVDLFLGELNDEDGVLGHKPDELHKPDLEVNVVLKAANPYAQICAYPGDRK